MLIAAVFWVWEHDREVMMFLISFFSSAVASNKGKLSFLQNVKTWCLTNTQICAHTCELLVTFTSLGWKCLVQLPGQTATLVVRALSVTPPDSNSLLAVFQSLQHTAVTAACVICCSSGGAGSSVVIDICYF